MAELFKFRCSECQKLLGVSPRKVGKPVDCPRCGAELIVPAPDDPAGSVVLDDGEGAAEFDGLGIDLGFSSPLDIRPAETPPPARLSERPDDELEAIAFLARVAEPAPNEPNAAPSDLDFDPESARPAEPAAEADDESEPLVATPVEPLLPRGHRARGIEPAVDRRRDVVLPRTAVVAWAMFAILALGMSFAAGLLIGHYRWR